MSLSRYVFLAWMAFAGLWPGAPVGGIKPGVGAQIARPFPQHVDYKEGVILPNHISRRRMDHSVRSFYKAWKDRYLRAGCNEGEYYVWFEGPETRNKLCVSEGQGY